MKSYKICQITTILIITIIFVKTYKTKNFTHINSKKSQNKTNKLKIKSQQTDSLTYGGLITHKIPVICLPSFLYNTTDGQNSTLYETIIDSAEVFWLNSGGAKILTLQPWFKDAKIEKVLSNCNGVLIQNLEIKLENFLNTEYYIFLLRIYQKVKLINQAGEYLPILALGSAMNILQMFEAKNTDITKTYNHTLSAEPITMDFLIDDAKKIRMMYFFDGRDVKNIKNIPCTSAFNINKAVTPDAYTKIPSLRNFFKLISIGKFQQNKNKIVAMIEAYRFPFYGVIFDPARFLFDKFSDLNLSNLSNESTTISQKILNFFISEAYKNLFYRAENKYSKQINSTETVKLFEKIFKGVDIHTLDLKKIVDNHLKGYFLDFQHTGEKLERENVIDLSLLNFTNLNSPFNSLKNKKTNKLNKASNATEGNEKYNTTSQNNSTNQLKKKTKKKKPKIPPKEESISNSKRKTNENRDFYQNILHRFEIFEY
jgi:hypothetical protein